MLVKYADVPILLAVNRKKLAQTEPKLVSSLVQLMDSPSLKVQCQAALALRNLASDGKPDTLLILCPNYGSQRSTNSRSSRPMVSRRCFAFSSQPIYPSSYPPPHVCAMYLFILRTNPLLSSQAFCSLSSTYCHSRTTKRSNVMPSPPCATWRLVQKRTNSPLSKLVQCKASKSLSWRSR